MYNGPSDFVHLHCHTVFSILDGVVTPEQLFSACADRGWPAVGVTEHGVLSSVPACYFASIDSKVRYLPGCEIYFNDYEPKRQELFDKGIKLSDIKKSDPELHMRISRNRHLTIIAKNETGFHNLVRMTTMAYETGFYGKPRIWFDKLVEYKEGLIILTGCLNGPISYEIRNKKLKSDDGKGAINYIEKFKSEFGDNLFLEMQMPCLDKKERDREVFWIFNKIRSKYNIPAVLTNDCHYLSLDDFNTQKLMMAVSQNLTIDSPKLFHANSNDQFLKTRAELYETFKTKGYSKHVTDADFDAICDNTLLVADKCDEFNLDFEPKIPSEDGDDDKLKRIVMKALMDKELHKSNKKYLVDNKMVTHLEQAKIELRRFIDKGFSSYFLITRELVKYSLENGWPVGPRGSVGGSLVCYLLGITFIDPLPLGLSFDRFLSPARGGYMLNIRPE